MRFIESNDLRGWVERGETLSSIATGIGSKHASARYLEDVVGIPFHLRFVVEKLMDERAARGESTEVSEEDLASIPFYSLCRGLFMPLAHMHPDKARSIFGLEVEAPPDAKGKEALLKEFLGKEVGLGLVDKLSCVLGDAFRGKPSTFRRDSLIRLLQSVTLKPRRELLDRLTIVGDVATLFAESRDELRGAPPLTALEVLNTLRFMREEARLFKFDILRSLLARAGKVEAYFLAKLLLRKAGFGFDYQGALLARAVAEHFSAHPDQVAHAIALTDVFHVADVLGREGVDGLKRIQLQPLVAVRPALATGTTEEIDSFPVWVERKYDGIRLMLHRSTGAQGNVLCGAYTRRRGDWLELIPGLDFTIKMIPAHSAIVDGELYGTVLDTHGGVRPATVYEVYYALQGERPQPITLKYAAFDLLYANGRDLTGLTLAERRQALQALIGPMGAAQTPVPLVVAEGQLAPNKDDLNRLYHHFRSQGYEGIITKDLSRPYMLATRDPSWRKRKPQITLDLVLLGGVFAVTSKEKAGLFGSYVIGARREDGSFEDVGDVAGVDRVRDAQIQSEIMREGLLTGRRIERPSSSGVRPGVELVPNIVVTVKFEGITRDNTTGRLGLRDPKLAMIRTDKSALEADSVDAIQEIFLKQRMG
jgi:DNA ligase-1